MANLHCFTLACSLALMVSSPFQARSAESLAWKFEPQSTFRYRLIQQSEMHMDLTGGGTLGTKVDQRIDLSWVVEKTNEKGDGELQLRIDRMQVDVKGPGGQSLHYDSAATERPSGFAAILDAPLKVLTSETYRMTISPRGLIGPIEIPEAIPEAFKNAPGGLWMQELATPKAFRTMLQACWLILPEDGQLDPSTSWSEEVETQSLLPEKSDSKEPANMGSSSRKNSYRYVGKESQGGIPLEKFEHESEFQFQPAEPGQGISIQILEQKASGESYFNPAEGRLESSVDQMEMSLRFTVDNQPVEQTLKQSVRCQRLREE